MKWQPDSLSKRFEFQAKSARNYATEIGPKMQEKPSYQVIYDMHVAEFMVFESLHGRTFLRSRELLLAELRRMKVNPPLGIGVNDEERHRSSYHQHVDSLIAEFETEGV